MENDNYKIRFTPLAYEDLDEIGTYISETFMRQAHITNQGHTASLAICP